MNPNDRAPRDWLLARHAGVTPNLDSLRRAVLLAPALSWRDILREFFRPNRTAWRALAVTWLLLVLFQLTHSRPVPDHQAVSPDAVAAWLSQINSNASFAQIDHRP